MKTVAVWLSLLVSVVSIYHAGAERPILDEIRSLGGRVSVDGKEIGFQYARQVGDDGLKLVAGLEAVETLNLRDTRITNAGLVHLKGKENLRRLHLERTAIDDEGLEHIAGLTSLEYLNLYGTKVTDVGLSHLGRLSKLEKVFLWQTGVTDEGGKQLEKALPSCRVNLGVDLDLIARKVDEEKAKPVGLVELKWIPTGTEDPPRSVSGSFTTVDIVNNSGMKVKLYWVEYGGDLRFYSEIEAGATLKRNTFSDATWVIKDMQDLPLGHFRSVVKPSRVVIPKQS